MPNFIAIQDASEINLSAQWCTSTKFESQDRIVRENGKPINSTYTGRTYKLIAKEEKSFLLFERAIRVILGCLAIVFTVGMAIRCKYIKKLLTEDKKKIRFGLCQPCPTQSQMNLILPINPKTE